jgi:aryl-alcohol dehydrogenase-like predicted oxidoreductase
MRYTELGESGIEVSTVSMGLWAISNDETWGPQDENNSIEAIRTAIDVGINFFDTAEAYGGGYSEEVLGKALEGHDREDVVVATKASPNNLRPEDLREALEGSLERLDTDYVDIYYLHYANPDVPIEDTAETLRNLREEGKIRAPAVSNFGPRDLTEILDHVHVVTNQLPYSLLWRPIEHELLDLCAESDVGVTCYSPLAQGLLADIWASPDEVPDGRARTRLYSRDRPMADHDETGVEKEVFEALDRIREICREEEITMVHAALAWVLARPGVSNILVGGRNPAEVRDSAKATEVDLGDDVLDRLTAATDPVKRALDENPDPWESNSRYH